MSMQPIERLGPGDRIMVVVAHPDDAEFMCSGSVAKWTGEGKEVVYVLATSGDKGSDDPAVVPWDRAKIREREQREVCDLLGVKAVEFLRYPDGMVENSLDLRKAIVRLIRKHKPNAVVTENPTNRWVGNRINHPDHRAVGDATVDAVFPSAGTCTCFPSCTPRRVWRPASWTTCMWEPGVTRPTCTSTSRRPSRRRSRR